MDECGLHTKYPGDEYCILPPPPDKGFQLHIGPSNYDNPEPEYLLAAGQEITSSFSAVSANDKDVYFYYRQFRMRPGAHHNIVTTSDGGGFGMGRRHPAPGQERHRREPAFHQRDPGNGTAGDLDQLLVPRFRRRDRARAGGVPDRQRRVRGAARSGHHSQTFPLLGHGHRHANNVRFSTWRLRGTQRDLIYEAYDWEEPLLLEYASNVDNPTPDPTAGIEGGWSGALDLMPGDQIEWECHVINQTQGVLRFTNNTYTGEMCIVDAEFVGATVSDVPVRGTHARCGRSGMVGGRDGEVRHE